MTLDLPQLLVHLQATNNFTVEKLSEDPDRESDFYCSGKPGHITYHVRISGNKQGVPINVSMDLINNWLHDLVVDTAGPYAGMPWDTSLFPIKNDLGEELYLDHPIASCRDACYWVLFVKPKRTR